MEKRDCAYVYIYPKTFYKIHIFTNNKYEGTKKAALSTAFQIVLVKNMYIDTNRKIEIKQADQLMKIYLIFFLAKTKTQVFIYPFWNLLQALHSFP